MYLNVHINLVVLSGMVWRTDKNVKPNHQTVTFYIRWIDWVYITKERDAVVIPVDKRWYSDGQRDSSTQQTVLRMHQSLGAALWRGSEWSAASHVPHRAPPSTFHLHSLYGFSWPGPVQLHYLSNRWEKVTLMLHYPKPPASARRRPTKQFRLLEKKEDGWGGARLPWSSFYSYLFMQQSFFKLIYIVYK